MRRAVGPHRIGARTRRASRDGLHAGEGERSRCRSSCWSTSAAVHRSQAGRRLPFGEPPVAADILARGWGYAMVGYQDIQPDRAEHRSTEGVIGLTLRAGRSSRRRTSGAPSAPGRGA